jgi:hypothetical protein
VWLKGLGQLKYPIISPGIIPTTFQLVAWCLNHYTTACPMNNILIFKNEKLNKSKLFTKHLVTKRFESLNQHVTYIPEHNKPCSQTLLAVSWVKCGQ